MTYADGNLVATRKHVVKISEETDNVWIQLERKRHVRAIATPVISFALLGVLVLGAVIFGNLVFLNARRWVQADRITRQRKAIAQRCLFIPMMTMR